MSSPTQRSLALMRKRGFALVQVVEHWNPHANIRQDLFGIIDVLCVGNGEVVAVQTTSDSHVRDRIAKMEATPGVLGHLRQARVRVLVHGWRKRNGRWLVQEVDLS